MEAETGARPARPRLNPYAKALRRERIFARLRLGWAYRDIAREERVSEQRIRQIVSDALQRQGVDTAQDHALLQLMRLETAHAVAARAIAAGDLKAIAPYLDVLERLGFGFPCGIFGIPCVQLGIPCASLGNPSCPRLRAAALMLPPALPVDSTDKPPARHAETPQPIRGAVLRVAAGPVPDVARSAI